MWGGACHRAVEKVVQCYRKEVGNCVGQEAATFRSRFAARFTVHSAFASSFCGFDLDTWSFAGERCPAQTCNLDAALECFDVDDITDPNTALNQGAR